MNETTQLKCEICGEVMEARVDNKKNRIFIFCPTMLTDHDIYVVNIAKKIKGDNICGAIKKNKLRN